MRSRASRFVVRAAASVTVLMVLAGMSAIAPGAVSAAAGGIRPRPYLVLGDSISAGYQPGQGDDPGGGYVARVSAGAAQRRAPLAVTNLACTGENTASMRRGGTCRYRQGSQQAAALAFLRRHPDTALITVSLGANDLLRCADRERTSVDATCVRRSAGAMRTNLSATLTELRCAAPNAFIIVLDYYDPFQAATLLGRRGRAVSQVPSTVHSQVNVVIRGAARDAGARVAYVTEPFDRQWWRRVDLPGHGRVPIRVARICTWTWMCSRVDIHPNDQGYRVIGDAVLTALSRRR